MITLDQIADPDRIARIVDWRQTPAWLRAALRNAPHVGMDTFEWMTRVSACQRATAVRQALLKRAPWSPLVQDDIAKLSWTQALRLAQGHHIEPKLRLVHQDTRVDHGRMLALLAALSPVVEKKLSSAAVAYRAGIQLDEMLCGVLSEIRAPENQFKFAATLDIRNAYDEVVWTTLDGALDLHLRADVDEAVLDLVRQSYRVAAVDRQGRAIKRRRGIPQGHILGPTLINLLLANLDRVVARTLANFGCRVWRYCDDFLIVGPTPKSIADATVVVERELRRLQLEIKPETKQIRDLQNPQNPGRWLGYAFTLHRTWVPRERVEKKAAELLQRLIRGRLSAEGLEAVLASIEAHHARVIHPDDAARAAQAIRKLLGPYLIQPEPTKERDPLENIRRQLSTRSLVARSQPARSRRHQKHQITLEAVKPATKGNAMILSHDDPRTPQGGSGHNPLRTSPPREGSTLNDGHDSVGLPRDEEVDQHIPLPSPSVTGTSLAASPPHRAAEPTHRDQAAHPGGAIGKNIHLITCRARGPGVVDVTVAKGSAVRSVRVRMAGLRSIEETLLHGYRVALFELVAESGCVVVQMRHPTLVGQVRDHQRVRSPALMRAWELLLDEIDRQPGRVSVTASRPDTLRSRSAKAHAAPAAHTSTTSSTATPTC